MSNYVGQISKKCKKSEFFHDLGRFTRKSVCKKALFSALGIGRATVLCNNAGLANPFKAGRSQGVCAAGTAKDCSQPPTLANHGQEPQELGNDRSHADKQLCPGCEFVYTHWHTIAPDTAASIDK